MDKTREEIKKLRKENEGVETRLKEVEDRIPGVVEEVLYDSTKRGSMRMLGYDLEGSGGQMWTQGENAQPVGLPAGGRLSIVDDAVISIERFNTEGRFEVAVRHYEQDGSDHEVIPKRLSTPGRRRFMVSFDAKVSSKPHTLRLTMRETPNSGLWHSEHEVTIDSRTWTAVKLYLKADPSVDCWLRIDDQGVVDAPSSIQLRKLKLIEAVSQSQL
jgi:hypothetical protein